eukprot:CAMPEP_0116137300 /NCGR_PEP_ID=MMETSP0329-20121206/12178_1 /TAXON_ID=697910 /ORGANISM="Pseudo-nitzschia arenysensis, Strain B593" /LENGTH=199 /DNA_ID=CAMNT_0003632213 /DNA_START=239 /DNA_END=838 /DNA_ORIENTATION=-
MVSAQSSSLLPATATPNTLFSEETIAENETQLRTVSDDEHDDADVGNGRATNSPLSRSGTRSASCNDMASGLEQQRQNSRGEQPQQAQEEEEVVIPATTTSFSRKSLFVLRPVHKYVDLVCICISVLAYLLETTMNAALAIFGIGVGVGLVLGDSFRAALPLLPAVQSQQQHQQGATNTTQGPIEIAMPRSVPNLLPAQ